MLNKKITISITFWIFNVINDLTKFNTFIARNILFVYPCGFNRFVLHG